MAPSRDIAQGFSVIENLRFICSGGTFGHQAKLVIKFQFFSNFDYLKYMHTVGVDTDLNLSSIHQLSKVS